MATRTNYTFQEIYSLMRDKINEYTSDKPTFWGQGSIVRAFFQSVAHMVEFLQLQINIAYQSFRTKSAKGFHLDRRMEDFNLERKLDTYATTIQTFLGDAGRTNDIIINSGLIVKTEPDIFGNTYSYALQNNLSLPSGTASVTGYVVCTELGIAGNVPSGTIIVLDSPVAGISGTINYEDVTNGTTRETDDQFRARLPEHLLGLKCGNKESIESKAYSVEGVTFVKVLENHPASGNFSVYISNESGNVDSVLINAVRDAIEEVRGICTTLSVIAPTQTNITIELDASINADTYDTGSLTSYMQQILFDYVNNIRRNNIYIADVIRILMSINGVLNVKNVLLNGVADDLSYSELYVAKIANLNDITTNII